MKVRRVVAAVILVFLAGPTEAAAQAEKKTAPISSGGALQLRRKKV